MIEKTTQTNIDIGAFDPQKLKNYMNRENDGDNQNNEDVNEEEKKDPERKDNEGPEEKKIEADLQTKSDLNQ